MRAVRRVEGQVAVVDVAPPSGSGVRVHVSSVGICGSDLHLIGTDLGLPDVTLGHEIGGITGDGTPVAIEPLSPCETCDMCMQGDYNLCRDSSMMIFGVGRNGGMAEEIVVPERALVPLPAGVDPTDAALVEPLAVLVHAYRRSNVTPDMRVAVIGGGTIGLCAVAVGKALGCEVALMARHDAQRAAGHRLGAVEVVGEYDLVFEAAGTESALATAINVAKPSAQVSVPGIYWHNVSLPGLPLCFNQITLRPTTLYGRHAGGRDVESAAALMAALPDLANTIITHRFPLEDAAQAFATASDRSTGSIKVVIEP
jgi:threonine dehydrogenase-like Zn-dependent dehydrogenase